MIGADDRRILRELARKVAAIADLPEQEELRELWRRHNRLEPTRPLVLVWPDGAWREVLPQSALECTGEKAREIEWNLRRSLFQYQLHEDWPIEKTFVVWKTIDRGNWGVEPQFRNSSDPTGAWGFDPVIVKPGDLAKLRFPKVTYDPDDTARNLAEAAEIFGGILDIQVKGIARLGFIPMSIYCKLRGLEQVMLDMYDDPQMLHEAVAFLLEGHQQRLKQYVELNLLSLNNDDTIHSSGGLGYSTELPKPGFDPQHVRTCDMWASAETQEMAQVSPKLHYEFTMQYEHRWMEEFGLCGYGCCDDLTDKLQYVMAMPHMRRISISPFANVDRCAEQLQGNFIFSWKPHPAYLVGQFDPEVIRAYIRHTLEVTQGCVVEMILKDTHTCENHPERFAQWAAIAKELCAQY